MPKYKKRSSRKKKADATGAEFKLIDPEVKLKENERCSEWHNNEPECKENKCWFYRNSKKCKAHLGILSGKPPKIKSSKKRYGRMSRLRRSSKKMSRMGRISRKSSKKRRSRRKKTYRSIL
jgi:hypothetical protein